MYSYQHSGGPYISVIKLMMYVSFYRSIDTVRRIYLFQVRISSNVPGGVLRLCPPPVSYTHLTLPTICSV